MAVPQPIASMSERSFAPSARFGPRFALLWLVVALLFQGFAIQTHAHVGADLTLAASSPVATGVADIQKKAPVAPACPLCEEKALFGAYLLAGSVTIAVPVATAYHYTPVALALRAPHPSSHAWRSRAPPIATT